VVHVARMGEMTVCTDFWLEESLVWEVNTKCVSGNRVVGVV
jgi:hypothetical protein